MVDGDCEVQTGWIRKGATVCVQSLNFAGVLSQLRGNLPERSIYNALCDDEWNTPIGDATSVGGIAMFRIAALREVDFIMQR